MKPGTDKQVDVKHPAKFSPQVLAEIRGVISRFGIEGWVVDPFAGVGGIHELANERVKTYGVEIEYEWATQMMDRGPGWCGDFFDWEPNFRVSAIVTSPTYGNRMADHHDAKDGTARMTYRHTLGRELSPHNSGELHWGSKYRLFHLRAISRWRELLIGGGWVIVNVKDHIAKGQVVEVADWWRVRLERAGFHLRSAIRVPVRGYRRGQNHEARVDHEMVYVVWKDRSRYGTFVIPTGEEQVLERE